MALIRQANSSAATRDAIVLDLGDVMRQGEAMRAAAKESAARIVEDAKRERDRLLAAAAEQGHREGMERGTAEGRRAGEELGRRDALAEFKERLNTLDTAWSAAAVRFEQDRERMLLEARQDVLRLAIRLGELVTRRAIEVRPETVVDQLAAVLDQIARPSRLAIRMHPQDRKLVEKALPGLSQAAAKASHIELNEDATLERGSVIAATDSGGEIDASIQTQLERIAQALVPARAGKAS